MDAEKTGKLICQLRNEKDLTQKELAQKLNVTDKAVSKWERGDGCPDVEMLPRLAEVFGVSVETIMEGEVKKSGIVAKGVTVKILDWTRLDILNKNQLWQMYRIAQKLAEKIKEKVSAVHGEECVCTCTSVDQLTNEEVVRTFQNPEFLYSFNLEQGGFGIEVDKVLGKRLLRQDLQKFGEISSFDMELLEKHFIDDISGNLFELMYESCDKSLSFDQFKIGVTGRSSNFMSMDVHFGEMCVLFTLNCKIGEDSGNLNFWFTCPYIYNLIGLGVLGRNMNVQNLESIKKKVNEPNVFVELGRFKAENVSLEEGKILILDKKFKSWNDNDPIDIVVNNTVVHTGIVCFTSNDLYAVRIDEDSIESPVIYDENDYLKFVLGTAYLSDEDLRAIRKDSVVELSQEVCSMVRIFRGDVHVASGEVCIADGKYAVRIAEVYK